MQRDRKLEELSGEELKALTLRLIERWHNNFHTTVRLSDAGSVNVLQIKTSVPVDPWRTKRVTLIGDAIHSMTPYRGIGATVALRDASLLCANLVAALRSERAVESALYGRKSRGSGYPRLHQYLLHQRAELSDFCGLAPRRDLFRIDAARARHGEGGIDRRDLRSRLHGGAVVARRAGTAVARGARVNGGGQAIVEGFGPEGAVAMELPAGSFSLHHTLCRHRSAPNRASHRRIGLGISYIPAHVRTIGSYRLSALLVRGFDTGGRLDLLPPPENELGAAELERHEGVYRRYRENYAEQTEWHDRRFAAT